MKKNKLNGDNQNAVTPRRSSRRSLKTVNYNENKVSTKNEETDTKNEENEKNENDSDFEQTEKIYTNNTKNKEKESSSESSDSDDEKLSSVRKKLKKTPAKKTPTLNQKRKNNSKASPSKTVDKESLLSKQQKQVIQNKLADKDRNEIVESFQPLVGFGSRPNLSEDESSESEDEFVTKKKKPTERNNSNNTLVNEMDEITEQQTSSDNKKVSNDVNSIENSQLVPEIIPTTSKQVINDISVTFKSDQVYSIPDIKTVTTTNISNNLKNTATITSNSLKNTDERMDEDPFPENKRKEELGSDKKNSKKNNITSKRKKSVFSVSEYEPVSKEMKATDEKLTNEENNSNQIRNKKRKKQGSIKDETNVKNVKVNIKKTKVKGVLKTEEMSDESETDNWEDVDEAKLKASPKKKKKIIEEEKKLDVKDLEISVGVQSIHNKKKKSRAEKMFLWVRQAMGRFQRERQLLYHKCHLLCILSKAYHDNKICNDSLVQGFCLSLISKDYFDPLPRKWNINHLRRFINWFQENVPSTGEMTLTMNEQSVATNIGMLSRIHILVIMLRTLGFLTRLIYSFQPCTHKIKRNEDLSTPTSSASKETPDQTPKQEDSSTTSSVSNKKTAKKNKIPKNSSKDRSISELQSPYFNKGKEHLNDNTRQKASQQGKSNNEKQTKQIKTKSLIKVSNRRNKERINYEIKSEDTEESAAESNKNKKNTSRTTSKNSSENTRGTRKISNNESDNEDFESSIKVKGTTPKQSTAKSKNQSRSNTPLMAATNSTEAGSNIWLEIYLDTLNKWICFELMSESLNQPYECEKMESKPLAYVVGLDNNNKIKDVTCRYASKWLSYNRKLRPDRDWWSETLTPFEPPHDVIHNSEDAQLKKDLMEQDFPKSISEFKDNPLYALKRHLLKFQALYPESAVPLGYIREEAIYSRDCVRELHTRETWMKQALVVKPGEVAYKIVKGRPRRNTPVMERDNIKVEVFGLWQTQTYVPPPVKDGIVPKNEYGNVELFKSCMLPEGAVHLPLNNIQKIARKLKIDYAPAMMGWDFHGGFSHPIIEGIVVGKEFEDQLLDAWRIDEAEQEKKDKEKREKKIYERWKTLIKGVLIRKKIQAKYKFEDVPHTTTASKPLVKKVATKQKKASNKSASKSYVTDNNDEYSNLSVSWPLNRLEGTTSISSGGHVHVFPEAKHKTVDEVTMKVCSCGLTLPLDNEEKM